MTGRGQVATGPPAPSPAVAADGWGYLEVDGRTMKDARLWPGGSGPWDWSGTGTSHGRGVQPGDLDDLLEHGAAHVVVSRGRASRLGVHPDTIARLDAAGVAWEVLPTPEAIARYEELRAAGVAVGALIHTTC